MSRYKPHWTYWVGFACPPGQMFMFDSMDEALAMQPPKNIQPELHRQLYMETWCRNDKGVQFSGDRPVEVTPDMKMDAAIRIQEEKLRLEEEREARRVARQSKGDERL